MNKKALGLVFGLMILGASHSSFAQATGTFNGRVVDQGGGVLPGTTVSATARGTGTVRTAVTNGDMTST